MNVDIYQKELDDFNKARLAFMDSLYRHFDTRSVQGNIIITDLDIRVRSDYFIRKSSDYIVKFNEYIDHSKIFAGEYAEKEAYKKVIGVLDSTKQIMIDVRKELDNGDKKLDNSAKKECIIEAFSNVLGKLSEERKFGKISNISLENKIRKKERIKNLRTIQR